MSFFLTSNIGEEKGLCLIESNRHRAWMKPASLVQLSDYVGNDKASRLLDLNWGGDECGVW